MTKPLMIIAGIALLAAGAFGVLILSRHFDILKEMVQVGSIYALSLGNFLLPTLFLDLAAAVAGLLLLIQGAKLD